MSDAPSHGKRTSRRRTHALLGVAIAAGTVPFLAAHDTQPRPEPRKATFAPRPAPGLAKPTPGPRPGFEMASFDAQAPLSWKPAPREAPASAIPAKPSRPLPRPAEVTMPMDHARLAVVAQPPAPPASATPHVDPAAQQSAPALPVSLADVDAEAVDRPIPLAALDTAAGVASHVEPVAVLDARPSLIASRIAPNDGEMAATTPGAASIAPAAPDGPVQTAELEPVNALAAPPAAAGPPSTQSATVAPPPTERAAPSPEPAREPRLAAAEPAIAPAPPGMSDHANGLDPRVDIAQISPAESQAYFARLTASTEKSRLAVRYQGREIGTVAFQVAAGHTISVHIGQVLDLFQGRFDTERFAFLRSSSASEQFVSLDRLQAAGIPVRYDPVYDEIVLSPSAG